MVVRAKDAEILSSYLRSAGVWDEMFTEAGEIRSHWTYLARALTGLGSRQLSRRQQEIERLVREHGITYNVYRDGRVEARPWSLDLLPLLVDSSEWAEIEAGLCQRAELLNLILTDLYGPRTLIHRGLLPPELIFAHRDFLRSCDRVLLSGERQLILYAADLIRGADGRMQVLSDRTQAPSGMGYALAGRTILRRVLPSLFRGVQVHRLARFFLSLRETLAGLMDPSGTSPRVAILTPGPLNETFFEHIYLAGYLDYLLVQGGELVVRDGRVWVRSLERLDPVEVILRRVDGDFLDPLELRPDSQLGAPGLIEAMRRRQLAIVNPPGSGILENPGLMAFLPNLARRLLGQDLKLPQAMTWWCGQAQARDHVLANLDRLVIKPIHRAPGERPVFGCELSAKEREAWRERILARPHLYAGQERLDPSTVPVFVAGGLEARPFVLRSFLVARRDDYQVMPGGLARTASRFWERLISNQAGAAAKDTWVLASEPEKRLSLWPQPAPAALIPVWRDVLPATAADNLFWLGRYSERSAALARSLRAALTLCNQVVEFSNDYDRECLQGIVQVLTWQAAVSAVDREDALEAWFLKILRDDSSCTLAADLTHLQRTAGAVRDYLSEDAVHALNQLGDLLDSVGDDELDLKVFLDKLVLSLAGLVGLAEEGMRRGRGWLLLDAGRRLERGFQIAAAVEYALASASGGISEARLEALLRALESLTAYRRSGGVIWQAAAVLELVLMDTANPRSLAYQLLRLQERFAALPEATEARDLVAAAFSALREADAEGLASQGANGALAQLMEEEMRTLARVSEVVTCRYCTELSPRFL